MPDAVGASMSEAEDVSVLSTADVSGLLTEVISVPFSISVVDFFDLFWLHFSTRRLHTTNMAAKSPTIDTQNSIPKENGNKSRIMICLKLFQVVDLFCLVRC